MNPATGIVIQNDKGSRVCAVCSKPLGDVHANTKYCPGCRPSVKDYDSWKNRRKKTPAIDQRFRAWDGEGFDRRYTLLQNSDGEYIYNRQGLSTDDCFKFLTSKRTPANNVWFGMSYDVNMMLKDVPWHRLRRLKEQGSCWYGNYFLRYIPRKFFTVTDHATGSSFHSYDVWGFFQSSFLGALQGWKIDYSPFMEEGKEARDSFSKWGKDDLIRYNGEEVEKLVWLMDSLRSAIQDAGWGINRWDGAGALASWFLNEHGVSHYIKDLGIDDALSHAYFGGRIDSYGWGTIDKIHHYDIVSAYPSAMRSCPDLSLLHPVRSNKIPDDPFALVHIRWRHKERANNYGLPYRRGDGTILYPRSGEGWYWNVEIEAAKRRFGTRLIIRKVESISFRGRQSFPLRSPIESAFEHRRLLKARGLASNIPIKLALNSLYGKTAQKKGWGSKMPRYRSLAWASYLTAVTRAKLQDAMSGDVVCTMTDSIWSRERLDLDIGEELGKWDSDSETVPFCIITPGVYQAGDTIYSRGFERILLDNEGIFRIAREFQSGRKSIPFTTRRFVGLSLAMMGGKWPDVWREFVPMDRALQNPEFFGTTKRAAHTGKKRRSKFRELESYDSDGGMSAPYTRQTITADVSLLEDRAADMDSEE